MILSTLLDIRRGSPLPWLIAVNFFAVGCTATAPRGLLERAIAARGGPLNGFVREAKTEVKETFPGTWTWRSAFARPERYAWSIDTTTGRDHYLFNGEEVRAYVGGGLVATDGSPRAPLRSHARFMRIIHLDGIGGTSDVQWKPVAPSELHGAPSTVKDGLLVEIPGSDETFLLGFDERPRLVWATGPIDVPYVGSGRLQAHFSDFRPAGNLELPYQTEYRLGEKVLGIESIHTWCPNPAGLSEESFVDPAKIPPCPAGATSTN